MCKIADALEQKGRDEGKAEIIAKFIKSYITNNHFTNSQIKENVLNACGETITDEEIDKVRESL